MSASQATDALMKVNGGKDRTVVEGHVNTVMDNMARRLGFEGKEAYEKFKEQRKERVRVGEEVKRRTGFEQSVENVVGKGGFGFAGIGEAILKTTEKGDMTIARAMEGAFGITTKDVGLLGGQAGVGKAMKNMGSYYGKKLGAAGGDYVESNKLMAEQKQLTTLLTSGKGEMGEDITSQDKRAFMKAMASGDEKEIEKAKKIFMTRHTKEGAKADLIERSRKELGGGFNVDKVNKETNDRFKETIPVLMGLKQSMGDTKFKSLFKGEDLAKMSGEAIQEKMKGMTDEDRTKAQAVIDKNKKAMGASGQNNSTEGILGQILELIKNFISESKGNKKDEVNIVVGS
jgi:hypothetical protein